MNLGVMVLIEIEILVFIVRNFLFIITHSILLLIYFKNFHNLWINFPQVVMEYYLRETFHPCRHVSYFFYSVTSVLSLTASIMSVLDLSNVMCAVTKFVVEVPFMTLTVYSNNCTLVNKIGMDITVKLELAGMNIFIKHSPL